MKVFHLSSYAAVSEVLRTSETYLLLDDFHFFQAILATTSPATMIANQVPGEGLRSWRLLMTTSRKEPKVSGVTLADISSDDWVTTGVGSTGMVSSGVWCKYHPSESYDSFAR